jgi:hypothetical protein
MSAPVYRAENPIAEGRKGLFTDRIEESEPAKAATLTSSADRTANTR